MFSLRKPGPTGTSRATSFRTDNVSKFHENLELTLQRKNFSGSKIFNLGESGLTTVHVPPKVIAGKRVKQELQMTPGMLGKLITIISALNAIGNSVPPFLIFLRKFFKHHMLNGAPLGTIGAANPRVIDFCKENRIIVLTLPPHTSHKLQALDRTAFSSVKKHYNIGCNKWMLAHAGRPIKIYDIAESVGIAYTISLIPKNIVSGFQVNGIYPFNRDVFDDILTFLSAIVSDTPIPSTSLFMQNMNESLVSDSLLTIIPE
ncbi:uncharacterized protein [Parasteatoda tepidariorum]|uniref:uncharacterized protein n=1 Tax=Parasteatoda tepidariorum TaxID=114398 RepID=UPI0039BC6A09